MLQAWHLWSEVGKASQASAELPETLFCIKACRMNLVPRPLSAKQLLYDCTQWSLALYIRMTSQLPKGGCAKCCLETWLCLWSCCCDVVFQDLNAIKPTEHRSSLHFSTSRNKFQLNNIGSFQHPKLFNLKSCPHCNTGRYISGH